MQEGQRNEGLQHLQHLPIDSHRLSVGQTAVHHAVPDPDQAVIRKLRPQMVDQMVERSVMPQPEPIGPGLFGFHGAVGLL
jgi:hypothetical protein